MNLTERAEVRKETFYKLTNSADVPEVPSGNRNLWIQSKVTGDFVEETLPDNHITGQKKCYRIPNYKELAFNIEPDFSSRLYEKVTFSAWVKYENVVQGENSWNRFNCFKHSLYLNNSSTGATSTVNFLTIASFVGTSDWKYITYTYDYSSNKSYDQLKTNIRFNLEGVKSGTVWVTGIKVEYGNVATPYSQAPEDLWSADTLVPTQEQRYLWKFEYVYYSDGSVEVTQPTNISIAGADGTNGQTSHVHFAFADNATGGGFSLTTPKAYMGWYADFNETASNDPTKYKWGKWKGDQGAPGGKGDDGKTSYLHLAFASSADGRTGFSFTESGQQYQGYYTDFTQTSSTDPTKYTWMDRRAGVEVGGRNLLLYTADPWKAPSDYYQFNGVTKTDETLNGSVVYKTHTAWASLRSNWGKQLIDRKNVKVGDEFTYSIYAKTDQSSMRVRLFFRYSGQSNAESMTGELTLTNEWQKLSVTFKITQKMLASQSKLSWVGFEQVTDSEDGKFVYYACNMLEEGNTPTPWSPALEDVQSDIDSKADQALTQQQLNALAEQNSIVKAEMEAKASIDTVNQWITAYQNYVNANDEAKAESERNLQEASARILQLKTDVGTLRQQWDFIDTYMTVQNEGLIIGKSDGSAYAKFANDRISLFSGSSEVMYISQGVLRIENGIFTKTIQIGRFRFETHPADADMLVLRYLGG